jgi:hypothetical protein
MITAADLPYSTSASGHDQHAQLRVMRELIQYLLAFGSRALPIDTLKRDRGAAKIQGNEIQSVCPAGEYNTVYVCQ